MKTATTRALIQLPGSAIAHEGRGASGMNSGESAACVSSHAVDERLSRWLLMTHDHAPGDEFEMKHEFMATMLGVTRSVVTRAAGRLQKEWMIRHTRGRVTVLDRDRLEATVCECDGVVKAYGLRSGL